MLAGAVGALPAEPALGAFLALGAAVVLAHFQAFLQVEALGQLRAVALGALVVLVAVLPQQGVQAAPLGALGARAEP